MFLFLWNSKLTCLYLFHHFWSPLFPACFSTVNWLPALLPSLSSVFLILLHSSLSFASYEMASLLLLDHNKIDYLIWSHFLLELHGVQLESALWVFCCVLLSFLWIKTTCKVMSFGLTFSHITLLHFALVHSQYFTPNSCSSCLPAGSLI